MDDILNLKVYLCFWIKFKIMFFEFLIYSFSLILLYIIGRIYNVYILKNMILEYGLSYIERVVINLIFGVFISVVTSAVFFSSFSSVYLILFIALFSPLFLLRNQKSIYVKCNFRIKKKHLVFFSTLLLLFFVYHQALFAFVTNTPFYDFLYLSKISSGILNNGIESAYSSNSAYYGVELTPHLYHYFEFWYTGVISKMSNYSEYQILLFVTFPTFHLLVYLVLFIIFENLFKSFYLSALLAFGFLFGIKIFMNYEGDFFQLARMYRGLPYSLLYKLLSIYLFGLLAYFFYLKKIYWLAIFSICSLLIIYPSTIPGISFLAVIVFIFDFFKVKKISAFSISVFFVILYLILFQKVMHFDKMTDLSFYPYTIKQYIVLLSESFIKIFIEHFLIIILMVVVLIKNFKLLIKNNLILSIYVALLGSILYVYFNPPGVRDINQIINNISPVLLLILSIELIQYFHKKSSIVFIIVLTLLAGGYNTYINFSSPYYKLLGTENNQSQEFVNSIEKMVYEHRDLNFCSISKNQPYNYYYHSGMKFNYLLKLKDLKTPLEIRVLFSGKESILRYKKQNKYYPPNNFFSENNNSNASIYTYLKSQDIRFLLLEKPSVSQVNLFLEKYCSLVLKDENTDDAIYLLN